MPNDAKKTITIHEKDFAPIRLKYLQLGREIDQLSVGVDPARENLMHSHSKLGCFLEDVLGSDVWRGPIKAEPTVREWLGVPEKQ